MKTELNTKPDNDSYVILVAFQRQLSDDLEVMQENYRTGKISANPDTDFDLAAQQQLTLELGQAYMDGLAGLHQCLETKQSVGLNLKAMGWKVD